MRRYFLVTFILFILTACSREALPPAQAVTGFIDAVINWDYEAARGFIAGDSPIPIFEIEEEYRNAFTLIIYTDTVETIENGSASVSLSLYTVDFAALMEEIMVEAFDYIFQEISTYQLTGIINSMLLERINAGDAPSAYRELTAYLELHDDVWKISPNHDFYDALTGGLLSFTDYAREALQ